MRTLNVLIVDDEAFVVDWIISLLDSQGDLPLNLFSCYGVTEAERMIEERRIDILLSDIRIAAARTGIFSKRRRMRLSSAKCGGPRWR